jgi:hypothetical protein
MSVFFAKSGYSMLVERSAASHPVDIVIYDGCCVLRPSHYIFQDLTPMVAGPFFFEND